MSHRDWNRIRKRVGDLTNPVSYLEGLAWTCTGAAISAVLALIIWLPTYWQLTPELQTNFRWVAPVMAIFLAACILVGAHSFRVNHQVHEQLRRDAQLVGEDMDDIYTPHMAATTGQGASPTTG